MFCYVVENNLALTKKNFNKIWRYTFLGIQGHGKGHKVKQLKISFFIFGDIFGILGEFPLRIWFSDPPWDL